VNVVGKSVPLIDAGAKATGAMEFVSDLNLPRMLTGKILRSPLPHARIVSIDTGRAKSVPGVAAVLTARDAPSYTFGPSKASPDWEILARSEVRFIGEEVAAVAATDPDAAEEALSLIKVEYEELPSVFDAFEALQPGAPLARSDKESNLVFRFFVEKGSVDQAFQESDLIIEDTFITNQVYQAYMETTCCVAAPDSDGRLKMWLPTQAPFICRLTYSKALGMPEEKIHTIQIPAGGAFGGKMESNLHIIAGLLARNTGKPVRIVNSREEDFTAGNPRVPMRIDLKIGFKSDGTIHAKQVRIYAGNGGRTVHAPGVLATACYRIDSLYRIKNLRNEGLLAYTNTVPTSAYRGFGNSQMIFAIETLLDMAAEKLGQDAGDLRVKNAYQGGEVTVHGWKITSCGLPECVEKVKSAASWTEKKKNKIPGRGLGLACTNHVSGNSAFFPDFHGSAAMVRVSREGRATVFSGEADTGQGIRTVMAQVAAEVLGLKIEDVLVAPLDSDLVPYGLGTWATRGTVNAGKAVQAAAGDARRQLIEFAAGLLGAEAAKVEMDNGFFMAKDNPGSKIKFSDVCEKAVYQRAGSPIIGQGFFVPDTVTPDPVTKYGNQSPVYPFGAHLAEVEVDQETGRVTILDYHAAHDVGKAINPIQTHGQIQGGVAQAVGWALMEDMVTAGGKVQNPNFLDYRIPTFADLPQVNSLLVEPVDPVGPYGAKGIGEPALNPGAAAVLNAIYDATGVRIKELPASQEKVLRGIKSRVQGGSQGAGKN